MRIPAFFALVAAVMPTIAGAQAINSAQLAPAIDFRVERVLALTNTPSASVAVVVHGKIVFAKAYGLASVEGGVPATAETRYPIGSVSKQFTAAALLKLESEGKLSLEDPVSRWLPSLTGSKQVTVRQLLSHTAGYQDYYPEDYTIRSVRRETTPQEIANNWGRKNLDFEPGTNWQYSNTGYVIAGLLVQGTADLPLFQYLKDNIFKPLGMESVADHDASTARQPDAVGYARAALGPARTAIPEAPGWLFATGNLAMTATDLAKWDISLIDRALLKPTAYEREVTTIKLRNGKDTGYAMGLFISKAAGRETYEHGGETAGFTSLNRVFPKDRAAIVVLTNIQDSSAATMIGALIGDLILPPTQTEILTRKTFIELQHGAVDYTSMSENLKDYLTPTIVKDFGDSLSGLGMPYLFQLRKEEQRGGMTFRAYSVHFERATLNLTTYETSDGKLDQFLVSRGG